MDFISQHILTANEVIAQEAVSSTTLVRNHQTTLSTSRQEPTLAKHNYSNCTTGPSRNIITLTNKQ